MKWPNKEDRAKKQVASAARRQQEIAKFGREVAREAFGGKVIAVHERGFVKIGGVFQEGTFERLVAIEASADVGKKSGLGRGVAAAMTMGVNLLGSNKRGDVYLTLVTDSQTYALREAPPTAGNMTRSKKLEAAGNSVLRAGAGTGNRVSSGARKASSGGTGVRERMNELKKLLAEGLITEDEFEQKRKSLLNEL
ncbi:hypothetical protein PS9374_04483 [Planomonospora sphaerica]|uniref:SHOCT domain-containing protein n=1 Tax=Planomonospora sphaerica TaxID=161355 RepID=A0A171DIX0_9ACTN|nr:SHOCT domain-containing protein [Planomonospora sphaerica]GAT68818.1 hypothetical protein PS9374_04483 [Planomonospora sphaerica]